MDQAEAKRIKRCERSRAYYAKNRDLIRAKAKSKAADLRALAALGELYKMQAENTPSGAAVVEPVEPTQ